MIIQEDEVLKFSRRRRRQDSARKGNASKARISKNRRLGKKPHGSYRYRDQAGDSSSILYKTCAIAGVYLEMGMDEVQFRYSWTQRLKGWKRIGKDDAPVKDKVEVEDVQSLVDQAVKSDEDLVEFTIQVDAWPLKFTPNGEVWEGYDADGTIFLSKAETVQRLVHKGRLELSVQDGPGKGNLLLDRR